MTGHEILKLRTRPRTLRQPQDIPEWIEIPPLNNMIVMNNVPIAGCSRMTFVVCTAASKYIWPAARRDGPADCPGDDLSHFVRIC